MKLEPALAKLTVGGVATALLVPAVAGGATADQVATTSSGGFGWPDVIVGTTFLVGIFLAALYGDRVVGALVVGLIELPLAAASLIARSARNRQRAGSPAGRIASRTARRMPQRPARSRPWEAK